jgi:hypothetical protein
MAEKSATAKKKDPIKESLVAPGHRACAGCGELLAARLVMDAAGEATIATCATGCLEVVSSAYPQSAWRMPWIHSLFENPAAVASGIEAALRAMGREGEAHIIAQGGDGSTADIGIGCLSGMLERGHNILYICYDNEAYMNTGVQRSGLTPFEASTTTAPSGKVSWGKPTDKKPMVEIAAAHGIPYAATASVGYYADLQKKVKKHKRAQVSSDPLSLSPGMGARSVADHQGGADRGADRTDPLSGDRARKGNGGQKDRQEEAGGGVSQTPRQVQAPAQEERRKRGDQENPGHRGCQYRQVPPGLIEDIRTGRARDQTCARLFCPAELWDPRPKDCNRF